MTIFKKVLDFLNPQVEEDEPLLEANQMYEITQAAIKENRNEAQEWAESRIKDIEKQMIESAKRGNFSTTVQVGSKPREYVHALTTLLENKGYHTTQNFNNLTIRWYTGIPGNMKPPTPK